MTCLLVFTFSTLAGKSPVTWTPAKIQETMLLGETTTLSVTFTSAIKLKKANLWAVPKLHPFVKSIVPASFETIQANIPYTVTIQLSASHDSIPGMYDGTIHLRVNNKTYPQPLKITLTVEDTENSPPVADAGPDQTVFVADTVTLDGSASPDADGDPLTYQWSIISIPPGSSAALSDYTAVKPTFVVDEPGTYIFQLIVNDGTVDSSPDTVTITTENSPPVANAGTDQTAFVTDTVTLNGSASSDVDGDSLTFTWSFISRPSDSSASLSSFTEVMPTFVVDKPGTYIVRLIVNDGTVDSSPDTVTITTENSPPVANAGTDQTVFVTDTVTLNGSASSDVDGDPLTYQWSLLSIPSGSTASLSGQTTVNPTFTIDKAGTYVAQLIVNDGTVDSAADTVTITTGNS